MVSDRNVHRLCWTVAYRDFLKECVFENVVCILLQTYTCKIPQVGHRVVHTKTREEEVSTLQNTTKKYIMTHTLKVCNYSNWCRSISGKNSLSTEATTL